VNHSKDVAMSWVRSPHLFKLSSVSVHVQRTFLISKKAVINNSNRVTPKLFNIFSLEETS